MDEKAGARHEKERGLQKEEYDFTPPQAPWIYNRSPAVWNTAGLLFECIGRRRGPLKPPPISLFRLRASFSERSEATAALLGYALNARPHACSAHAASPSCHVKVRRPGKSLVWDRSHCAYSFITTNSAKEEALWKLGSRNCGIRRSSA